MGCRAEQNFEAMEEEDEGATAPEDELGNRVEIREGEAERSNQARITTRYMTKYERARILGTRALQIRYVLSLTTLSSFFPPP